MPPNLTLGVSVAAALLSAFAAYRGFRDPAFAAPLSSYDFSSPNAALKSTLQIKAEGNRLALMELENRQRRREALPSFDIAKRAEWRGRQVLFATIYGGKNVQHAAVMFEKNANERWLPANPPPSFADEAKALKASMDAWDKNGAL